MELSWLGSEPRTPAGAGAPLRAKDAEDLALIRSLIPAQRIKDLGRYCVIYPAP
jgi:hypothetical protein